MNNNPRLKIRTMCAIPIYKYQQFLLISKATFCSYLNYSLYSSIHLFPAVSICIRSKNYHHLRGKHRWWCLSMPVGIIEKWQFNISFDHLWIIPLGIDSYKCSIVQYGPIYQYTDLYFIEANILFYFGSFRLTAVYISWFLDTLTFCFLPLVKWPQLCR